MRISKLDNRYKLKKAGIATYLVLSTMQGSLPIQKKLEEAYGPGRYVRYGEKSYHTPLNYEWYYTHKRIGTHAGNVSYSTEIYLRREDQVSFLTMAMS